MKTTFKVFDLRENNVHTGTLDSCLKFVGEDDSYSIQIWSKEGYWLSTLACFW